MNKTESVMVGSINYETPVMVAREVDWLRDEVRKLTNEVEALTARCGALKRAYDSIFDKALALERAAQETEVCHCGQRSCSQCGEDPAAYLGAPTR